MNSANGRHNRDDNDESQAKVGHVAGSNTDLEEFVKQEGEPVCEHLLGDRLRSEKNKTKGKRCERITLVFTLFFFAKNLQTKAAS